MTVSQGCGRPEVPPSSSGIRPSGDRRNESPGWSQGETGRRRTGVADVAGVNTGAPDDRLPVHRLQRRPSARRSGFKIRAVSDDDHRVESSLGDLSDEVNLACLDQVNRSTRRGALFAPVAAGALVLIFAGTVPLVELLVWAFSATLASVAAVWCAELYLRRRRAGVDVGRWRIGPLSSGLCGFVWASLPFFAFPSEGHYDLRAIYLIFLCGISAANAVGTAARRSYFLAFQIRAFRAYSRGLPVGTGQTHPGARSGRARVPLGDDRGPSGSAHRRGE